MDRAFRDLSAADAAITQPENKNVIWLLPDLSKNPLDPSDPTQMLLVRMMGAVQCPLSADQAHRWARFEETLNPDLLRDNLMDEDATTR